MTKMGGDHPPVGAAAGPPSALRRASSQRRTVFRAAFAMRSPCRPGEIARWTAQSIKAPASAAEEMPAVLRKRGVKLPVDSLRERLQRVFARVHCDKPAWPRRLGHGSDLGQQDRSAVQPPRPEAVERFIGFSR